MKPGTMRITFELLAWGQSKAYGPTISRFRMFVERVKVCKFLPYPVSDTTARKYAKAHHGWYEKGEGDWASPRLKSMRRVSEGVWEVSIHEAYTD